MNVSLCSIQRDLLWIISAAVTFPRFLQFPISPPVALYNSITLQQSEGEHRCTGIPLMGLKKMCFQLLWFNFQATEATERSEIACCSEMKCHAGASKESFWMLKPSARVHKCEGISRELCDGWQRGYKESLKSAILSRYRYMRTHAWLWNKKKKTWIQTYRLTKGNEHKQCRGSQTFPVTRHFRGRKILMPNLQSYQITIKHLKSLY